MEKKNKKKRDIRATAQQLRVFEKIQIDATYLDDIPAVHAEYICHTLPCYQFTARGVRAGAVCMARV